MEPSTRLSRRLLLRAGCALGLGCLGAAPPLEAAPRFPAAGVREAAHYRKLAGGQVRCDLCPCSPTDGFCGFLSEGEVCACRVRFNRGGKLYVSNYGQIATLQLDPVEKNPVYHFRPGSRSLALGTAGCNMACSCCQNWELSQSGVEKVRNMAITPARAVDRALENGCGSISYTFTEPVVFFEYVRDTARLARARGLKNCLVTGGYVNPEPARELGGLVDTVSVSIKALTEKDYQKHCKGSLEVIQAALKAFQQGGAWVEVAFLVVPGISDDPAGIGRLCGWIRKELGSEVPVHFSRFFPEYRMKYLPPTPVASLEAARKAALARGLKYVYIGNVAGHDANNTRCPGCRELLVQRLGFKVLKNRLQSGRCPRCRTSLPGTWV
ncbi:MAG: AmmeMemoRadiSam system radical SAM enzyme [Armatimonadetes bacterium]|nr:AmmeMemoRadiSam system radical SAM enzyme [Armatimonadota bacterium]